MDKIQQITKEAYRDISFDDLMSKRIHNVLLVATNYDAFMLEDDGRVEEQIFNEYTALNMRHPPRFSQVTNVDKALAMMKKNTFELIIVMPNMDDSDIFGSSRLIRERHPQVPIVVLTPFSREMSKRIENEDTSSVDYIFSWLGSADVLLAIIKLVEDDMNTADDSEIGVRIILVVEDSMRFYSSVLPMLYKYVLEQSNEFSKEALNAHQAMLRKRGRPKIKLARNYDEAVSFFDKYSNNILGVISDFGFPKDGKNDPMAGRDFVNYIRQPVPVEIDKKTTEMRILPIPVILESSESACAAIAAELNASFVDKNSKTYQEDMLKTVMEHFGFGDFVIFDPVTNDEIVRIKDLKDLQQKIFGIPDDALKYHLSHDHFSRFFYSRAMFPPANQLKKIAVGYYKNMDEARQIIFDAIVRYRRLKNLGTVADYHPDRFDHYSHFARLGEGSLGGKGRGLAFIDLMTKRYPALNNEAFPVLIPKTVVLCADIFDRFMESNNLYPIALSDAPDAEIFERFQNAFLPDTPISDLRTFFNVVDGPLAIRSSSLLEDAHYQPFAGVYSTYMTPNRDDKDEMLHVVGSAIKGVYASVFYQASKAYMKATSNRVDREKMAVVLQEIVGTRFGDRFYPLLSGVARSLNYYPVGNEQIHDGIANIALGLGKYIVDGGVALRFSPRWAHHIIQLNSPETALRDTQTRFFALDLARLFRNVELNDDFNLLKLSLKDAEADGSLPFVASTYDAQNQSIISGTETAGRRIISFANILEHEKLPLATTLDKLLKIGEKEMGGPVEIEFAVDIPVASDKNAAFYFLQIRPIVNSSEFIGEDLSLIPRTQTLIYSSSALGNGVSTDVSDIVYVRKNGFNPANNGLIAKEIERINSQFDGERNYILAGPGRWGSEDPWLGIPVKWTQICNARLIVECSYENYRIEPSQGTHFFQNLTSHGVGYFTVNSSSDSDFFNEERLESLKENIVSDSGGVRWLHFDTPLRIMIDGRKSIGVVEIVDL